MQFVHLEFSVHILLKPSLKEFEHYLASIWNNCNCAVVWTFLDIVLLWYWNEKWPFPVLWPLLSFPNLLAYWVQHFHSIFRIWNSSAGIPSPPVALFVVNLPKAHLTLCCRISGSSWVITPSRLSVSLRPFLYSSSVYCCHLLLISYTSVRSFLFLSCTVPIFAWNVPLTSPVFLKRSLVFPILLFSSISLHCSFKKAFLTLLAVSWTLHSVEYVFPFLLCLSLLFFPRLFVKPPQTATLPSCIHFSLGWFGSPPPVQC